MALFRTFSTRRQGVSLVEALVALAVMSIGMLALVGVQTTMRLNSDLAKQRTEATRIASEEIETLRSFARMGANDPGLGNAYDTIATRTVENYTPPDNIGNTSYRVVRTVTDLAGSNGPNMTPGTNQKVVTVRVEWMDRAEREQRAADGAGPRIGHQPQEGPACQHSRRRRAGAGGRPGNR
jgi:type II secretory pathway pseudopilin PulG